MTGATIEVEQAGEGRPRRFGHEAMATTFEILLPDGESPNARMAVDEAFKELDALERELSRFVRTSDVAQLNTLEPGAWLRVGRATFECLDAAAEVWWRTGGAFDVTVGPLMSFWGGRDLDLSDSERRHLESVRERVGLDKLEFDPDNSKVSVKMARVGIDLGGVGKGYALDRMAEVLARWEVGPALVHGGQSTVLALGAPEGGWRLALRDPSAPERLIARVTLREGVLAGSGILIHGRHIIDPRSGWPVAARAGSWSWAPDGARSDAWSTAFMVLEPNNIEQICDGAHDVGAILIAPTPDRPALTQFGQWRHADVAPLDPPPTEEQQ